MFSFNCLAENESSDDMLNDEEGDDDDNDGWEECDEEMLPNEARCLFCSASFSSPVDVFLHCAAAHDFDIALVKEKQNLDCISYIKLINFIRRNVSTT